MSTLGPSNIVSHKSGKLVHSGEKTVVLNMFNKFCKENLTVAVKDVEQRTFEFTGVSVDSVHNLSLIHI